MANPAENALSEVLAAYAFAGEVVGAARFGQGHINDTFCVYTQTAEGDCVRYILQRMSAAAFNHPDQLMQNIVGVTDYLRDLIEKDGGDAARETMTVLRTKNGAAYFTDSEGGAWRVYPFVENTLCLQKAETPELFYASAKAFGNFQRMLKDYPADTLFETIEKFHDTENRLANFEKALAADKLGRAKDCAPEIAFVKAHAADCSVALEALRAGRLPLRVTHNDTKLNNILIDKDTGEGICVIDLDTVMPGLSINDFGDSIRFGANHSAEDERDLSKVNFDLPLFDIYTKGFLEGAAGTLTDAEKEYLPWGAKLMTLECGIRFLTDYLEGDHYFHTARPDQRIHEVVDEVLELLMDLDATPEQLDSPMLFCAGRNGTASYSPDVVGTDLKPLFDTILEYIPAPDNILDYISKYYGVDKEVICGQQRVKDAVSARQIAMYLIRSITKLSVVDIGKVFDNRDHSTVLYSLKQVEKQMKTDPAFAETVKEIKANINNRS